MGGLGAGTCVQSELGHVLPFPRGAVAPGDSAAGRQWELALFTQQQRWIWPEPARSPCRLGSHVWEELAKVRSSDHDLKMEQWTLEIMGQCL